MANKVRFYHLWTFKHISQILLGIVSLIFVFWILYFYPRIINYYKLSKFDSETIGVIVNVKENTVIRQSEYGNKIVLEHYDVDYKYQVKGKEYYKSEIVTGKGMFGYRLKKIFSTEKKIIEIRFISQNPSKCMIDLTER